MDESSSETAGSDAAAADTGLSCLVLVARLHQLAADAGALRHEFAGNDTVFDDVAVVRAARWLGLKARAVRADMPGLARIPLPAIVRLRGGEYAVLGGIGPDSVLLCTPPQRAPRTLSPDAFVKCWTGIVIPVTRRTFLGSARRRFDFSWFVPFILKYRRYLLEVLLASLFLQVLALITPLFFQLVIDKVLVHHGLTTLDILAVGLLIVSLFEVVLGGLRTYVFAHTANRIDVALGAELFRHLLRLPASYFGARRVGDTVARVRELESVRNFITGSSVTVLVDAGFTAVFFVLMYAYSPLLTLVVAATLPLYAVLALVVTPLLRARLNEKFDRGADNHAYLVECVSGIETLKASAVEPATQRRWEERLAAYVQASFRTTNLSGIANQVAALINKLMVLGILWCGAHAVMAGALTVGQLVAFNMLAGRIAGPMLRLVQLWQDFQQAGISVQRLGDILNAQPEPAHTPGRSALPEIAGQVRFDNVTFRYRPGEHEALAGFSMTANPGEVIGIVGRSGSGKSTVARLIQRLHVPESGRVLVDGVDLALVDVAWLRRRIGVVLQENVLFNRSVRENIALADPSLPMPRVVQAARLAGAHDFILALARGYDTELGEQGANLSGGQRQRIALARALITNPRILILDEATSALDFESELTIQRNMREICEQRTVFIVAHRLSAVRMADRIVVLEGGRIAEQGPHDALLRRGGYYAELCRCQGPMAAAGQVR